jgi:hypothetical protein
MLCGEADFVLSARRGRAPLPAKGGFIDALLREFLTEASKSLDTADNQLVRFEQEPNNTKISDKISRLVHPIKGTRGAGSDRAPLKT